MRELEERRVAQEDRREKPGAGYGMAASLDPDNGRIEIRRDWKRRNLPRYAPLTDPLHPEDEAALVSFLREFNPTVEAEGK